jgi:hypothetical protein
MPYWDDGSGQSKSQYDSSGGYDNTGNQNNNSPQTIAKKAPPKKPKVTKDNKVSEGFIKNYFNNHPVYSTLNKLSKSKFATNLNAKRRQKYLENLKEEDIDAYNQTVGDLEKVNYVKRGLEYYGPKSKGAARDIETFTDLGEEQALEILGQRYKNTLPTFNNNNSGDNSQPYIPINYNTGAAEVVEPYTNDFTYRFGDDQNVIFDDYGTSGYRTTAAEGGIMGTRARRAMGGIMNRVDKRQQFFLGGIGKAIKGVVGGVVDATKKVFKSDIGKMAIAGAAFYYGGGGSKVFSSGEGFMGGLKAMGSNFMSTKNPLLFTGGKLSLGKLGLASAALPFLAGGAKPNEMNFSNRGGSLRNSQGLEGNQAIRDEIYDAYESGDSDKIASLQRYYGYKLPALSAVNLPSSGIHLPFGNYGSEGYRTTVATGGRIGKAEGGLMDLGGMEKDYRNDGGFVPIGEYEKKDDVPARLSVNEFVFTADAVRGAGQGDIDKGAEIMENMMENLENGGTVSEESQGNKGAQQMFETSERLGAVI